MKAPGVVVAPGVVASTKSTLGVEGAVLGARAPPDDATAAGGARPPAAPETPAMSDEAAGRVDDADPDESFALDDDDDLDLTAEMERLGIRDDDFDVDENDDDDDDDDAGRAPDASAVDLDETRVDDEHDAEEAEVRRRMDAELEMNLRRAELAHVELELKLVASEESVRAAREALAAAEAERDDVQRRAHVAWEEVSDVEKLIAEEKARRAEEDAAKAKAEVQARAIVEADDLRQRGNEAYRRGDSAASEALYKSAIDQLQSCGIVLEEPSHLTLRTNRAAALMALGRMREALAECEEVLGLNPENVRARSRAGNCCIKLGNLDAAKAHVDAIVSGPEATPEDLRAASEQHQKILVACVERDRLVGNESYRRGDYDGALTWYDAALRAAGDVSDASEAARGVRAIQVGLHTNRAAAHLMKGNPLPAAEDCCAALRLDSAHTKAQVRLARCLLQLGDFAEAKQEASDVETRDNAELQSKAEARNVVKDVEAVEGTIKDVGDALKLAEIKASQGAANVPVGAGVWVDDFDARKTAEEALEKIAAALVLAPQVPDLVTLKAEALRFLGRGEEALELLSGRKAVNARRRFLEVRLHFDAGNLAACADAGEDVKELLDLVPEFRAEAAKKRDGDEKEEPKESPEGEEEEAEAEVRETLMAELASAPDPEGLTLLLERAAKIAARKETGRAAFQRGKHQEALATYAEALRMSAGVPMLEGLFLSNQCACEQALGRYADALSSAGTAVSVAPTFVKAHSRLATIYAELSMLADAQAAYGAMLELPLEASEEEQARAGLERARARAKNEHPVDWAKLLGVDAAAAGAAVKKAYRQLALVHHPDKAGKGGASAGVAKARAVMSGKLFKHVGEANRVLTDPAERAKWESAKMRAERAERVAANSRATRNAGYGYGGGSAYDRYDHYASADYFRQQYGGTSYGFDYSDDDGVEDWI